MLIGWDELLEIALSWETESDDWPYIFNSMKSFEKVLQIALNKKISFRDLTL